MVRAFFVGARFAVRGPLERLSVFAVESVRGLDAPVDAHDGLRRLEEPLVLVPHARRALLHWCAHGRWGPARAVRGTGRRLAAAERLPRGSAMPCLPCACARRAAALIARAPLASRGCPPEGCLSFPRDACCLGRKIRSRTLATHTSHKLECCSQGTYKLVSVPNRSAKQRFGISGGTRAGALQQKARHD